MKWPAVRVLLLVLLFVIWESAADAPAAVVRPGVGVAVLAVGYAALVGVMAVWGRRVAADPGDSYDALGRRVDRFNLGMGAARGLVPAWFAAGVFALGWRRTVAAALGPAAVDWLVTPGVTVGILPPLAAWAGLWWAQYPVDRSVREHSALAHIEAELPVFAPPPLGRYLANKLRAQLLFTVVPVLMILGVRDVGTLAVHVAGRRPSPAIESGVSLGSVAVVLLVVPVVLRRVLSTRPLPDGQLRQSLADVLALAGVRCRQILLWDTHHNLGNAAVMGVLPPVRYVMLSDLLLESMTDAHVQAVFAHELGHVRHRHLAWLAVVLGSALAVLSAGGDWAADHLHPATPARAVAVQVGLVAALAAVVWVGYGTLSRWFERQADVYAVRLLDRAATAGGGAAVFTGALRRVAVVNNIPLSAGNWTHGSIAKRIGFIHRLAIDPDVGPRYDRAVRRVRVGLVALVLGSGGAMLWWYHPWLTSTLVPASSAIVDRPAEP